MSTPYASYAEIIKAVIMADDKITQDERDRFEMFFREYHHLTKQQSDDLWFSTSDDTTHIQKHIDAIKADLAGHPAEMIQFFKFLNSCIYRDELSDIEYKTFEHIEELLLA